MKKAFRIITLFVAVASMAFITSCKKDNENLIIGKWQFDNVNLSITVDDPEIQAMVDQFINGEILLLNAELKNTQLEFKGDGTYTLIDEDGTNPGTYSIDGDKITLDGDLATIKTLTKNALVIEMSETLTEEDDGMDGTMVMTMEYTRL